MAANAVQAQEATASKLPPASIFVPLAEDLTQPLDVPSEQVKRIGSIIRRVEEHHKLVGDNILAHYERKKEQLLQQARNTAPNEKVHVDEEESRHIQWLVSAEKISGQPHAATDMPSQKPVFFDETNKLGLGITERDRYYNLVMQTVEDSIDRSKVHQEATEALLARWRAALHRELAQDAGLLV